jgi:chromosomal replication initiator protein
MQPGMTPADPGFDGSNDLQSLVMAELKARLGDRRFELWCEDKVRPSLADDQLTLAVGSPFLLNCMQKQFQPLLNEVAQLVLGPAARAVLTVDASLGLSNQQRHQSPSTPAAKSPAAAPATPSVRRESAPIGRQRKLADLSEFVPHPANELAWTASRQVAATPGAHFSTLFLHGVVGTGKTHLLEGICRQLRRTHPTLQVALLTAEGFANYFTQALGDRTLPSFRQKFRSVDVLLVDDVDFFEAKRVFQEEFLHTVGELVDHGRQVVVSADRHPKLLTKLSDELVSRFHSGLVCRLETPDVETRRKIVAAKAAKLDGEFAAEALDYIAERFSGSVRELEGALNCLQTCFAMTQKRVTLATARQMLADLEQDCRKIVKLADVERVVCNLFGLKAKDLKSDSRVRTLAQPRMLAMFLARRHTPSAYSEIGQHFGGRNHSTVMSAERKVQQWLTENAQVRIATQSWTIGELVNTLEQQLLAG